MNKKDISGQIIGKLTVIKDSGKRSGPGQNILWEMICKCGNICLKTSYNARKTQVCPKCSSIVKNRCNARKFVDYIGYKTETMMVIDRITGDHNNAALLVCICQCGATYKIRTCDLKIRQVCTDCKKSKSRTGKISNVFYNHVLKTAHERGIKFDLTTEDMSKILDLQSNKCVYTGREFIFDIDVGIVNRAKSTLSADRINSKDHYHINNLQFVLKDVNYMKYTYSHNYFLHLVKLIYENYYSEFEFDDIEIEENKVSKHLSKLLKTSKKTQNVQVDENYVLDILLKQKCRCAYSGERLDLMQSNPNGGFKDCSMDRIDSSIGYVPGNIQFIKRDINIMKNDIPELIFLSYIKDIYFNRQLYLNISQVTETPA